MRSPAYISLTVAAMASLACLYKSDWIPTEEHVTGETVQSSLQQKGAQSSSRCKDERKTYCYMNIMEGFVLVLL